MKNFYKISFLIIFLLNSLILFSSEPLFEKFRLIYKKNPCHNATIGWCGSKDVILYYDTIPYFADIKKYSNSQKVSKSNKHKGLNNNFVEFDNLIDGKIYFFVLFDTIKKVSSRMLSFRTVSKDCKNLLIVAGGDSRNSFPILEMSPKKCKKGRRNANVIVSKIVPDFVVFGGDYVMNKLALFRNKEWKNWLDDWQLTINKDGLLIPIIPEIGNHETYEDMKCFFDISENDYLIKIDNFLSILTLDNIKNVNNKESVYKLENFLKESSKSKWQIVQYHIPMYPHGVKYKPRFDVFYRWGPLFKKYKVDVISECHAHNMKTTYPIELQFNDKENPFLRNDTNGIIFIGEGGWGAPLRKLKTKTEYIFSQDMFHGFHLIDLNKNCMKIYQITLNNIDNIESSPSDRKDNILPKNIVINKTDNLEYLEVIKN